jgi:hypothetical protein
MALKADGTIGQTAAIQMKNDAQCDAIGFASVQH